MAETHVVFALKEKRARVAGELDKAQLRVMRLRSDLASVDCCLKMFKPDCDPSAIKPKTIFGKNPAGVPKGAGGRLALDVLRETGGAFTCEELATRVLLRLGKEPERRAVAMLGWPHLQSSARGQAGCFGLVPFVWDSELDSKNKTRTHWGDQEDMPAEVSQFYGPWYQSNRSGLHIGGLSDSAVAQKGIMFHVKHHPALARTNSLAY